MLETIAIILIGFIPGLLASYLATTGIRRYTRRRRYHQAFGEAPARQLLPSFPTPDYRYIEGLGYIIGDLSCQYNARSPHLRCAINPSGPCNGCSYYEALHFPEEMENAKQIRLRPLD